MGSGDPNESHDTQPDDAHAWRIAEREIALITPRWKVERSARTRAGEDSAHEFYRVLDEDFVHVIALTADRELVLVREFHHGVERAMLTLPGGGVDRGESFADAARRELLEETGYEAEKLERLGVFWPSPKRQNNKGEAFVARGVRSVAPPTPDATEDIRVELVPVDEIGGLIASREFAGGFSMACLLLWLTVGGTVDWPA